MTDPQTMATFMERWARLAGGVKPLSMEERVAFTRNVSEVAGVDLLSKGILLTGEVSLGDTEQTAMAIVQTDLVIVQTVTYKYDKPGFEQKLPQLPKG